MTLGRDFPGSKLPWATVFHLGKEKIGTAKWPSSLEMLIGPSHLPLFVRRAHLSPLNCKKEYLVLALAEETASQAVVGSIVWVFRRLGR